jgi:hypothetical protein
MIEFCIFTIIEVLAYVTGLWALSLTTVSNDGVYWMLTFLFIAAQSLTWFCLIDGERR